MKPATPEAMRRLIAQVRAAIPFAAPAAQVCTGACEGCSRTLLDFLDGELTHWEARLAEGVRPTLGEVSALARTSRKVYAVLARNGLVAGAAGGEQT